jgi:hypothetical protein
MASDDLDALLDRELRELPAPRAPGTLLPRVMAASELWAARPWYMRDWFSWPLPLRIASVIALVALGYTTWMLRSLPIAAAGALATYAGSFGGDVTGTVERAVVTTSAARVLWRTLVEPFMAYAFGIVILMCLACAAFGTALNYVFLERAEQR